MAKFCCRDFESLYELSYVWYDQDDEVWYLYLYNDEYESGEPHEVYHCPFCGTKLESEE